MYENLQNRRRRLHVRVDHTVRFVRQNKLDIKLKYIIIYKYTYIENITNMKNSNLCQSQDPQIFLYEILSQSERFGPDCVPDRQTDRFTVEFIIYLGMDLILLYRVWE